MYQYKWSDCFQWICFPFVSINFKFMIRNNLSFTVAISVAIDWIETKRYDRVLTPIVWRAMRKLWWLAQRILCTRLRMNVNSLDRRHIKTRDNHLFRMDFVQFHCRPRMIRAVLLYHQMGVVSIPRDQGVNITWYIELVLLTSSASYLS